MKSKILLLGLLVLSGCASIQKNKALKGMTITAPVQKIYMSAKKYEFGPDVVRIKQGTHVIIEIESLDTTHGFEIKQFGINVRIPAKEKVKVEFYAREPGVYPFKCSHFCGTGHFRMKGKAIVMSEK